MDYYAGLHLTRIHQFVNSRHHPVIVCVVISIGEGSLTANFMCLGSSSPLAIE